MKMVLGGGSVMEMPRADDLMLMTYEFCFHR